MTQESSAYELTLPATPRPMGEWRERGACKDHNPGMWFPEQGDSRTVRKAQAICAECPVKAECLEWALTLPERYGVWGGTSERQRRGRYRPLCRECHRVSVQTNNGQKYCEPCKVKRHNEWKRKWYEANKEEHRFRVRRAEFKRREREKLAG